MLDPFLGAASFGASELERTQASASPWCFKRHLVHADLVENQPNLHEFSSGCSLTGTLSRLVNRHQCKFVQTHDLLHPN